MLAPHERQEKIIRATDLDALSCRFNANNKSYFQPVDPFIDTLINSYQLNLPYCSGYSTLSAGRTIRSVFNEQKLPLINRGTYLRTKVIDEVIDEFINENGKCQIISLGSGSDTRCFRILENKNVIFHEIDFSESVKIKKLAILNDQKLKERVGHIENNKTIEVKSKEEFKNLESDLHTDKYHLYGYDLRQLKEDMDYDDSSLSQYVRSNLPTLVLSECVLCYLSANENENIIKFWKSFFEKSGELLSILIYEPLSLNDNFGVTMTQNLANRGIELPMFNKYPTLSSRNDFLSKICGLKNIKITDMCDVSEYDEKSDNEKRWLDINEINRINKLELIDEIEEIKLLFKHYCLCFADYSSKAKFFNGINKWRWLNSNKN